MTMDMSKYLDVFLEESKEHIENLNQKLLDLERNPQDKDAINEIFRAAHTLKGMSSTMGFEDLADLTHNMEDILSDLKEEIVGANSFVVDVLFQCFDRIQAMIEKIESGNEVEQNNADLIAVLNQIKHGNFSAAETIEADIRGSIAKTPVKNSDEYKTALSDLNDYDITVLKEAVGRGFKIFYINVGVDQGCLMKAVRAFMVFKALEDDGEVIKTIPPAQDIDEGKFDGDFNLFLVSHVSENEIVKHIDHISEVKVIEIKEVKADYLNIGAETPPAAVARDAGVIDHNAKETRKSPKVKQTVRVDIERLDSLMNLVGELVMHKGRLEQIGSNRKIVELNETMEQIDRVTTELQSVVMKVRMVPVEQVFNRFPRMVRDLAKDLNKEIDFIIEGQETELDRTVIDEIGDPLVHLLRNALDHGVEPVHERLAAGKPRHGTVILRARHEGNNVYIEVEDDGQGINSQQVLSKAVEKGIITAKEAEQMSWEEVIALLFHPGFSTSQNVTDVSGRGVGLDAVKTKIESLSGEIFVDAKPGQGTRFKIKLPLTLAIIQALMIEICSEVYAIPLSSVDETTMINKNDIKMVQNQEVIMMRGTVLPLFRLASLLEVPDRDNEASESMYVVVVRKADRRIGLIVDTLIGQQEIVIKSLGKLFLGLPGIAGAIVAGDGNVRLILDIATLF